MVWLIGCRGMLGQQTALELQKNDIPFEGTDIETDITDIEALRGFAEGKNISWIINCSAYTAVDKAESEEDKAYRINADGAGNIAKVADELGAKFIHFSTDYVFDGTKEGEYQESDPVNPVSAYGRTKLAGEEKLKSGTDRYFIFRISWLYGVYGPNFVKTMVRLFNERDTLGIVSDQKGAPTYAGTLAENIVKLIKSGSDAYGTYHYSDGGRISWYNFAVEINKQAVSKGLCKAGVTLNAITADQYPTPAKRPANSSFDRSRAKRLGFVINQWEDNLERYFNELEKIQ